VGLVVTIGWTLNGLVHPTLGAEVTSSSSVPVLVGGESASPGASARQGALVSTAGPWRIATQWQGPQEVPEEREDYVLGWTDGHVELSEVNEEGTISAGGHASRLVTVEGRIGGVRVSGSAAVWVCDETLRAFSTIAAVDYTHPSASKIERAEAFTDSGPRPILKQALEHVACHGHGDVRYPTLEATVPPRWRRDKSEGGDAGGWYSRDFSQQVFAALVREAMPASGSACDALAKSEIAATTGSYVADSFATPPSTTGCTGTGLPQDGSFVRFDVRPCPVFPEVLVYTLGTYADTVPEAERIDPTGMIQCVEGDG